ncbi:MAG: PAAR domain-containing protein [Niabella sp.]
MGKPAARSGDMHVCPLVNGVVPHVGGPILPPGTPTVLIGGMPAATMGDMCTCVGPPDTIVLGSTGVLIGGKPAARMGDITSHGGNIVLGCFTVLIGETSPGGGGGGAAGSAGGGAGGSAPKAGAKQSKDNKNSKQLKEAAKKGEDTADKQNKDDYKAKFSYVDEAGKPMKDTKYEITTNDGKKYEGKTNSNGETEEVSGYTTVDCTVAFFKK